MNCFHKAVKDKVHLENCKFKKHGFMKIMDPNKKVCVIVNDCEYQFDYETNKLYEISDMNIKFAVCIGNGKQILFLNQDYILSKDSTYPYRTFYEGLMKEPFKFCYPFEEQVIVEVKKGKRLRFFIGNR